METLIRDIRFGLRSLLKRPSFTVIAVITLALGIGANTAIFTVVNSVLLRPLSYPQPDRLVTIRGTNPSIGQNDIPLSVADYLDWRSQNHVFESLAAFSDNRFNYTSGASPEQLHGAWVTADFFKTLGVAAQVGRTFLPDEDGPERLPLVVVSHGFWQRRLGGAQPIGQQIQLNGTSFTIIGVMPENFKFPEDDIELWAPEKLSPPPRRGPYYMTGLARLAPGTNLQQARAEMNALARYVQQATHSTKNDWTFTATSLTETVVGDIRRPLLVLLGAVVFVLLIASVNIANLLLARGAAREKEIAIRRALGAGRGRLVGQMLTESGILAALGAAVGLFFSMWGVKALLWLSPDSIPRLSEVQMDARVLVFTILVSLASGMVFGFAPVWQSLRLSPNESLKESSGARTGGLRHHRLRSALVVSEVALSLMLLIGAGLLIKSFWLLQRTNPGFQPENLLSMQITLPRLKYSEPKQTQDFFDQLIGKVKSLPGVDSAGASISLPPNLLELSDNFAVENHPTAPGQSDPVAPLLFVSSDYFRTMRIPVLRGRSFTEADNANSPPVGIISETMARSYFAGEDPIGKRFKEGTANDKNPWMEVVGVVADVKYSGLDANPEAAYYMPHRQNPWRAMYLVVRTASDPISLAPAIRAEVWSIDKDQPVAKVRTMDQLMAASVSQPRFRTLLLGVFGVAALMLAAMGIYGVMSYAVAQRTREIGIRMALGARMRDVTRLVVVNGMRLTLIGAATGLLLALALTRVMASLLFGVTPTDAATFGTVSLFLMLVALVACYIPARRATKVDPLEALRYE